MREYHNICPDCFKQVTSGRICSHCGYEKTENVNSLALEPGTVLKERYVVGRVLGAGGFGITYKTYDLLNHRVCAMKEFVPMGIAVRKIDSVTLTAHSEDKIDIFEHGKKRFLEEAEILKKLNYIQSVVNITDYFMANGTVYYIMEYLNGANLNQVRRNMGGKIPFKIATEIIVSVARCVARIHEQANIFHRDISPENIYITVDGEIKLIDFGSAKYLVSQRSQNLTIVLKPGFAPPEQYSSTGKQGTYTDVYALAATYYFILTGEKIPAAPERLTGENYPSLAQMSKEFQPVSDFIDRALKTNYKDRVQNADELADFLEKTVKGQKTEKRQIIQNPRPYIEGIQGCCRGYRWYLPSNRILSLGRSQKAKIVINGNDEISNHHCDIFFDTLNYSFYLQDCSRNGIYMGGQRLKKGEVYVIREGETFTLSINACTIKVGYC